MRKSEGGASRPPRQGRGWGRHHSLSGLEDEGGGWGGVKGEDPSRTDLKLSHFFPHNVSVQVQNGNDKTTKTPHRAGPLPSLQAPAESFTSPGLDLTFLSLLNLIATVREGRMGGMGGRGSQGERCAKRRVLGY